MDPAGLSSVGDLLHVFTQDIGGTGWDPIGEITGIGYDVLKLIYELYERRVISGQDLVSGACIATKGVFGCSDEQLQIQQRALEGGPIPIPPTPPGTPQNREPRYATDPNQKLGPGGLGANSVVSPKGAFSYRLDCGNETNATAPAQQVLITDTLDSNLDLPTFQWAELGWGDQLIVVPPRTQHFETNVPMSYLGADFEVQVELGLNSGLGQAYAIFRCVDPATSLPPPVNIGFLPPEDGTGRGQGHVSYNINAKTNSPTGAQIRNVAMISFDKQPSIATNQKDPNNPAAGTEPAKECLNTIDAIPPTSHVLPLPGESAAPQFQVTWMGQDDAGGSGVAGYNIYASDNGAAWALWLSGTTNAGAMFAGLPGHSYAFYSVAQDHVGNVEQKAPTAEAQTMVSAIPSLSITLTNGWVFISWPAATDGFVLQTAGGLGSTANWMAATNVALVVGDEKTVVLQPGAQCQFYRLKKN